MSAFQFIAPIAPWAASVQQPTIEALPEPGCRHWTAAKKAIVAIAVLQGVISVPEACKRYELSLEELANWQKAFCSNGWRGLQASRLLKYRKRMLSQHPRP